MKIDAFDQVSFVLFQIVTVCAASQFVLQYLKTNFNPNHTKNVKQVTGHEQHRNASVMNHMENHEEVDR